MYDYHGKDLGRSFRTVRNNTIQIAEDIPEDQYGFRPAEGCRTVAETLAHIVTATQFPIQAVREKLTQFTVDMFPKIMEQRQRQEAELTTKSKIIQALRTEGEKFATFLEGLDDATLSEWVSFPPEAQQAPKTRFELLLSAKEHEMHHRGQLMVAERMLGIVPHLTRHMQERMAAMTQRQQTAKGA